MRKHAAVVAAVVAQRTAPGAHAATMQQQREQRRQSRRSLQRRRQGACFAIAEGGGDSSSSSSSDAPQEQESESAQQAREALRRALSEALGADAPDVDELWPRAAPAWTAACASADGASADGAAAAAAARELTAGLAALLAVVPPCAAARLLRQQPALAAAPLAAWRAFLDASGFTPAQQRDLLAAAPEVVARGDLVRAGAALRHLRALGFEDDAARHKVVAWAPHVLLMREEEITGVIRLWSKFRVGVDERGGG